MSAVLSVASEQATFRPSPATARDAQRQAYEAELSGLGRQVQQRGEIEGAMRLRALAEIEALFSTHDLCRLAAEA